MPVCFYGAQCSISTDTHSMDGSALTASLPTPSLRVACGMLMGLVVTLLCTWHCTLLPSSDRQTVCGEFPLFNLFLPSSLSYIYVYFVIDIYIYFFVLENITVTPSTKISLKF